ncbi:MAG: hypothetical protein AAF432_04060 [Planctomycetota bacterium]
MRDQTTGNSSFRYELIAESSADTTAFDPITFARRTLRGRWAQAIVAAIILGAAGGYAGYTAATPLYESNGLVRVAGALPPILYESQENQLPPNFDAFVSAQATFLTSRQVLTAALDSPYLKGTAWPRGNKGIVALENSMSVKRPRGEQVISVAVRHQEPSLAQAAVNGILYAFDNGYSDPDHISYEAKEETLRARDAELQSELAEIRTQMLTASDQYGVEAIEQMHDSTVKQLMAVDQKLAELDLARTSLLDGSPNIDIVSNAPINFAAADNALTELRVREQSIIAEIDSWNRKYGPRHPIIRELARQLEAVRIELNLRESDAPSSSDMMANQGAAMARLDRLTDRYDEIRHDLQTAAASLGTKMVELHGLQERQSETQQRLQLTRQRLDELDVEASRPTTERVTIAAAADFPITPVVDRRIGLAAAGAILGTSIGLMLIMVAGATDSRLRYVDELGRYVDESSLLAVLPRLTGKHDVAHHMAEHGVHQLRNTLELQQSTSGTPVYTVTSPSRGDGRTSLALGLAMSSASAGRRTLLIDADMSDAALTAQLGLRGKAGLCEAIGTGNDGGEVHETRYHDLWVLPIGHQNNVSPEDIGRDRLAWLLDGIRDRFESIIIDTGSLADSVEAPVVSAAADRVVLVVSRDQQTRRFKRCLQQLDRLGITIPAVVFNRASARDLDRVKSVAPARDERTANIRFVDAPSDFSVATATAGRIGAPTTHTHQQAA